MKNSILILLLGYSLSGFSQTSADSSKVFWGTFGFAGYHSGSSEGFGFNISTDYLKNKNYWKLRFINVYEFDIEIFSQTIPDEKFYDIGLLYGRIKKTKFIRLSIAGGLGLFGGVKRGPFEYSTSSTWGLGSKYYYREDHILSPAIPLEVDLNLIPFKYVGIGISGFANLNIENSMVGFTIKLELGRLR